MSFLKTIKPEEASGPVAEIYGMAQERIGLVPAPLQLRSASPDLMPIAVQAMGYYMSHPNLSPGLLALIRMLVAEEMGYNYCVSFNSNILKSMGVADDDQLAAIMADPMQAPVADKEKALLALVIKVCSKQERLEEAEVVKLREMGWQDSDIYDAVVHGLNMILDGIMEKAFGLPGGAAC